MAANAKKTTSSIDRKRSLAAKKGAATRTKNREIAASRQLRLHHKLVGGGAILAVVVFAAMGIYNVLTAYAATDAIALKGVGGKCLDISNNRMRNGTKIRLYNCNGSNAQKWILTSDGSIKSANGKYCVDIPGGSTRQNIRIQLYRCNGTKSQKFAVTGKTIAHTWSKRCLTSASDNPSNGTSVVMKTCRPQSKTQVWQATSSNPTTPTTNTTPTNTTPTTPPVTTAPTTPSIPTTAPTTGSSMPKGNLSGWKQVLAQDFTSNASIGQFGNAYGGWNGYDGNTSGHSGVTWNSATTMSAHDGMLDFKQWVNGGKAQVGALTPIIPGTGAWYQQAQTYGKYSVRYKIDPNQDGFKIAWLLWPTSNNWNEGEIDFPEGTFGDKLTYSTHNVTGNPVDQVWGYAGGGRIDDGQWHVSTITWEPGKVSFDLDGKTIKTVTDGNFVPSKPMRWDLQVETNGNTPSSGTVGHAYIDWLVQYSRS